MIGKFRHRIKILKSTKTTDSIGGFSEIFTEESEVSALVNTLSGTDLAVGQAGFSGATLSAKLRYYNGLNTDDRIGYRDKEYHVTGVRNPDGRKIITELFLREVT